MGKNVLKRYFILQGFLYWQCEALKTLKLLSAFEPVYGNELTGLTLIDHRALLDHKW
jgi:hypothetical protein